MTNRTRTCFRTVEPGVFTGTDVTALHALCGRPGPTVDPSIAALASGGYEVAFQANTSDLWVTGPGRLGTATEILPGPAAGPPIASSGPRPGRREALLSTSSS